MPQSHTFTDDLIVHYFFFVYVSEKFEFRANVSARGNSAAALCEVERKEK